MVIQFCILSCTSISLSGVWVSICEGLHLVSLISEIAVLLNISVYYLLLPFWEFPQSLPHGCDLCIHYLPNLLHRAVPLKRQQVLDLTLRVIHFVHFHPCIYTYSCSHQLRVWLMQSFWCKLQHFQASTTILHRESGWHKAPLPPVCIISSEMAFVQYEIVFLTQWRTHHVISYVTEHYLCGGQSTACSQHFTNQSCKSVQTKEKIAHYHVNGTMYGPRESESATFEAGHSSACRSSHHSSVII